MQDASTRRLSRLPVLAAQSPSRPSGERVFEHVTKTRPSSKLFTASSETNMVKEARISTPPQFRPRTRSGEEENKPSHKQHYKTKSLSVTSHVSQSPSYRPISTSTPNVLRRVSSSFQEDCLSCEALRSEFLELRSCFADLAFTVAKQDVQLQDLNRALANLDIHDSNAHYRSITGNYLRSTNINYGSRSDRSSSRDLIDPRLELDSQDEDIF